MALKPSASKNAPGLGLSGVFPLRAVQNSGLWQCVRFSIFLSLPRQLEITAMDTDEVQLENRLGLSLDELIARQQATKKTGRGERKVRHRCDQALPDAPSLCMNSFVSILGSDTVSADGVVCLYGMCACSTHASCTDSSCQLPRAAHMCASLRNCAVYE